MTDQYWLELCPSVLITFLIFVLFYSVNWRMARSCCCSKSLILSFPSCSCCLRLCFSSLPVLVWVFSTRSLWRQQYPRYSRVLIWPCNSLSIGGFLGLDPFLFNLAVACRVIFIACIMAVFISLISLMDVSMFRNSCVSVAAKTCLSKVPKCQVFGLGLFHLILW